MSVHEISARQVRAIANGTCTAADLGVLVAGQRSKALAMLALLVRTAEEARHPGARAAAEGWRLLARVQRRAPGAVEDLVRYPAVSAWATAALLALGRPRTAPSSAATPERLALVAAAAAMRGDVPCVIDLPPALCAGPFVHLPSLGSALLPAGLRGEAAVLRHGGAGTVIAGRHADILLPPRLDVDAPCWHALTPVTVGAGRTRLRLLIDDADPHRLLGGQGPPPERLPAAQREAWARRLRGGWRLLARYHQQTAADVLTFVRMVTPLGGERVSQSVTGRQAFGSISLSLPEDDVAAALTLAHEVQHVKLCALMDLVPLIGGPAPDLHYAPWRTDPRPLSCLVQGMFAHLEVARFWRRHREVTPDPAEAHHASVEFARWREACAEVGDVLSTAAGLTKCGDTFVDGMIQVLRAWRHEYVPPGAQAQAERAASEHRRQWDRRRLGRDNGGNDTGQRR